MVRCALQPIPSKERPRLAGPSGGDEHAAPGDVEVEQDGDEHATRVDVEVEQDGDEHATPVNIEVVQDFPSMRTWDPFDPQ